MNILSGMSHVVQFFHLFLCFDICSVFGLLLIFYGEQ